MRGERGTRQTMLALLLIAGRAGRGILMSMAARLVWNASGRRQTSGASGSRVVARDLE